MTTTTAIESAGRADGANRSGWGHSLWAVVAAFGCYFCMYFFRKPFTAGSYSGTEVFGWGFKTVLVSTQVTGYMVSKFVGIRVVAELPSQHRAAAILGLVTASELALIGFGLLPRPWNAPFLFLNGLALGMVFGLVLGHLEGRRSTEALAAGLCASFILADGMTKSAGTWLLSMGVAEDWMPAAVGGLFLLPIAGFVAMLARVRPPCPADIAHRSARDTMGRTDRADFLRRYGVGLAPIVLMYLLVTILRSIRSDFAPELWRGLGLDAQPSTFTFSETWVALGVLLANGVAVLIRSNRAAFLASLATSAFGFVLLVAALVLRGSGSLGSFGFMVLAGLGLYLPYVAVHTTIFERLLAMTRDRGNVGFLMYVADSVGYLGFVIVMLSRNTGAAGDNLIGFFEMACWISAGTSWIGLLIAWRFFAALRPASITP